MHWIEWLITISTFKFLQTMLFQIFSQQIWTTYWNLPMMTPLTKKRRKWYRKQWLCNQNSGNAVWTRFISTFVFWKDRKNVKRSWMRRTTDVSILKMLSSIQSNQPSSFLWIGYSVWRYEYWPMFGVHGRQFSDRTSNWRRHRMR